MKCIGIIKDEDLGLKSIENKNPRTRFASRGIIINNDKIAIFNKTQKNEYKLPGGGIETNETPEEAFIREAKEETGCEVEIIKKLGTIEEHKTLDNFKQISHIFVAKVINNTNKLDLTKKEKDEGARLIWVDIYKALDLVSNCFKDLKESEYENLYHTKFIVLRDKLILEYYIKNKGKIW